MDKLNMISCSVDINATLKKVWDCFTMPEHITKWYFASDDWCAPNATNNLTIGEKLNIRMESKDGTMGFDFWGVYTQIEHQKYLELTLGDNRNMCVHFETIDNLVRLTELFEPETENPVDMQQTGWQMILNNLKIYAESF